MKILHTSDWHLGKKLEGYSRIKEQEKFIDNLVKITKGEEVDIIVIAGDIYDVPSPPTEAERLFFKGIKKLSNHGKIPIIIIPGNHDNAERLGASSPLAEEDGIIIFEKPFEKKEVGKYGNFEITNSHEGSIELDLHGEKVFIYALPYPSEKALGERFIENNTNEEQVSYSRRIGNILKEGLSKNNEDIPSIIITHIFVSGSICEDNERPIELGGSLAVNLSDLPDADYIALGHIHKPMVYHDKKAVYSGSPIEYRVSENKYNKKVFIATLHGNHNTDIRGIEIDNYKPIKRYSVDSIEEAIQKSEDLLETNEWIYLEVRSHRPLQNHEVREIKRNKNIIEIIPIIDWNNNEINEISDYTNENIEEVFKGFYKKKNNIEPSKEILELFNSLLSEVD